MVLAGLLAGGLTASTALSDADVSATASASLVSSLTPTAAPSTRAVSVPPAESQSLAAIDAAVQHEEAVAEWEYRRKAPAAASRSAATPGTFQRPARGAVTGVFGERRRSHIHPGTDFDGETGDPVVSAAGGTVIHAGQAPDGYSGYGLMVLIDHGSGVTTLYAHLSRIGVRSGTSIGAGDYVGAIGSTGNVTGSHLHFEVRMGDRPVNPMNWLAR